MLIIYLELTSNSYAGLLGSTVTTQYYAFDSKYNGVGSPETFVADGTIQSMFGGSDGTNDYFGIIILCR